MFQSKKGNIMRHPYATLLIIGLATAGVISIGEKIKCVCTRKNTALSNVMHGFKGDMHLYDQG